MIIRKAFRYRIYPNSEQEQLLAIQFGHARFVWNWGLNQRQSAYKETGKGIGFYDLKRRMTELKRQQETEWLKEADSQVLQGKIEDLDSAYKNFFEKRAKYPRFKSKKGNQSIRYPQRFKFSEKATYLPKVGWVKTKFHRPLEGKAKNITVSKTKTGKYFASIQCEIEIFEPVIHNGEIGVDLGIKSFLVTSEGEQIDNPKHLQKSEKRLIRLQRKLSRCRKGSSGREKTRILLARQHEKVANQRTDFLHKISRSLVDRYGLIGLENLNVRGMVKNRKLAKAISSTGWGAFRLMLAYKGEWYGSFVHQINRFYPSSKTCSVCGHVLSELGLSVREWECLACGVSLDRDVNAAINILNQTRAGVAQSNAGGESVSPGIQAVRVETGSPPAFSGG
jgi:putative transposase